MYEPSVFAVLTPWNTRAGDAFRLDGNAALLSKDFGGNLVDPDISSREPTPATPDPAEKDYDPVDRILLAFDKKPKNLQRGWQFGTRLLSSDVLLGRRRAPGISARHFCIQIVDGYRVELHEDSTYGTAVGYDGQAKYEARRKNTWILAFEPGKLLPWGEIIIYVPDAKRLAFKIEFPNHAAGQPSYLANLQAFSNEQRATLPTIDGLGLNSELSTVAPTLPRTPRQRPIYVRKELVGKGEFGEVHKVINVGNGSLYAGKTFFPPSGKRAGSNKRKIDHDKWLHAVRKEVAIMRENPHVSVSLLS